MIVITDGDDPQVFTQIDNAIETILPDTKILRYCWYIVHQGFSCPDYTTFPNIPANIVNKYKKIVLIWVDEETMPYFFTI